jgi:hypothetical protein
VVLFLGLAVALGFGAAPIAAGEAPPAGRNPSAGGGSMERQIKSLEFRIKVQTNILDAMRKSVAAWKGKAPKSTTDRIVVLQKQLDDLKKQLAELKAKRGTPAGDHGSPFERTTRTAGKLEYPRVPANVGKGPWPRITLAKKHTPIAERMESFKWRHGIHEQRVRLNRAGRKKTHAEIVLDNRLLKEHWDSRLSLPPITPAELLSTIPPSARGPWKDMQTWTREQHEAANKWLKENTCCVIWEVAGKIYSVSQFTAKHMRIVILHTAVVDGSEVPVRAEVALGAKQIGNLRELKPDTRVRVRAVAALPSRLHVQMHGKNYLRVGSVQVTHITVLED